MFFSNGPGDPARADRAGRAAAGRCWTAACPYFGICFGNQLFGRALGLGTYKLSYGHRGINQPVHGPDDRQGRGHRAQPRLRGGRAARRPTETPYGVAEVSHVCLNDDVVEGLSCGATALTAFSVQYHPEAAAGPHDAAYLFDRFVDLMIPYFGICFGNQLFGRALGFDTFKLKYGHRGINQPVMDRTTGKVEVTAHNHGFAVDAPLDGEHRDAVRRGRRSATSASTTTSSRGSSCGATGCRRSPCSTTPRPRPGRTTRRTCSTGSCDLIGGPRRCRSATTSSQRPGDRLRADRDRAGVRVRLLRHPGLPGAARPRASG